MAGGDSEAEGQMSMSCSARGDVDALAHAEALKHNCALQSFTLNCGRGSIGDASCLALADALKHNGLLKDFTLNCRRSSMGDAGCVALADALKRSRTIEAFTLRCDDTGIGDAGCAALADALKHNCTLKAFTLHCGGTSLGNASGLALADVLKQSRTLQLFELVCYETGMSDASGVALAEALKHNRMLQGFTLDRRGTGMGDASDVALRGALCQNCTLLDLCLDEDFLFEHILERNRELLQTWRTLVSLARRGPSGGLQSLTSYDFRNELLSYFMPQDCTETPRYFGKSSGDRAKTNIATASGETLGSDAIGVARYAVCDAPSHACIADGVRLGNPGGVPVTSACAPVFAALPVPEEFIAVHSEAPAVIPPAEAAATQDQIWASSIEASLGHGAATAVTIPASRLVLLAFSRCTRQLEEALLASPPAVAAAAAGVDLQPFWARGAKIFARGVDEDSLLAEQLRPWHLVIGEEDEDELFSALQHLPHNIRRLRSSENIVRDHDSSSTWTNPDEDRLVPDIAIARTFVHYADGGDTRSSRTW